MKNKTVLYGIAIFLFFIAILQLTLLLENHRFKFDHFLIVILLIILLLFRNKVSWSFFIDFLLVWRV
jgi:Ca2+/Na+ antiporter